MNDHSVYDHAQTDMGPYTDYDQSLSQHPYYQHNEYPSAPHVAQYAAPQPSYNQGYAKFEGALELRLNIIGSIKGNFVISAF